jgi:hypothetical protein
MIGGRSESKALIEIFTPSDNREGMGKPASPPQGVGTPVLV